MNVAGAWNKDGLVRSGVMVMVKSMVRVKMMSIGKWFL